MCDNAAGYIEYRSARRCSSAQQVSTTDSVDQCYQDVISAGSTKCPESKFEFNESTSNCSCCKTDSDMSGSAYMTYLITYPLGGEVKCSFKLTGDKCEWWMDFDYEGDETASGDLCYVKDVSSSGPIFYPNTYQRMCLTKTCPPYNILDTDGNCDECGTGYIPNSTARSCTYR